MAKITELKQAQISKYYFKHEKQVILLIISDGENSHCLAVRKLEIKGQVTKKQGEIFFILLEAKVKDILMQKLE